MAAVAAAALCTPLSAWAQTAGAGSVPEAVADAPSTSSITFAPGKTSSGWLPFELFAGTRILIPVEVNGRPVLVMLDSGASSTVLDRQYAADLGLEAQGDHTGQGEGGSTSYSLVRGVELKIGDLNWKEGEAVAIDLSAVSRQVGRSLPIILGGEMFTDTVVEIDFQGRRIAFHDPANYVAPPEAGAARLTPAAENQAISILVEGRPATLLFDLGNAGAIDLYPRFWEQPDFMDGRATSTTFAGGVGGMHEQKIAMLDRIEVGGTELRQLPTRLSSGETSVDDRAGPLDGNLGIGVLGRFHLTVDFPHHRVLFAPPVDVATPFRINHAGLTLRPDPAGPVVLHVGQGSPAASAGLVAGDVIVSVDEAAPEDQSTGAWQYGAVGDVVHLRLADGRSMAVTLAAYF